MSAIAEGLGGGGERVEGCAGLGARRNRVSALGGGLGGMTGAGPGGVSVISQVCSTESMYSTGAFPFLGSTLSRHPRAGFLSFWPTLWQLKASYVLAPGQ